MSKLFYLVMTGLILFICISFYFYKSNNTVKPNGKIAIITSIYGNYDNLKEQRIKNKDKVDWYCFTDNLNLKNDLWNIINTPYHLQDKDNDKFVKYKYHYSNIDKSKNPKIYNMMCAKYYKIKTHKIDILQKYDYFIWVDGSVFLRPDFIDNMIYNCNNYNLINFKHSERDNIKDEYELSITIPKYNDKDLYNQYQTYINKEFPDNIGLFENTIFARKNDNRINHIFDKWWVHNLEYSFQDQISYPFVLWESKSIPDLIIQENVFNNHNYSYVDFGLMKNH
jgi:hypothetical protein